MTITLYRNFPLVWTMSSNKIHSYHFVLANGTEYRDLTSVFPDILNLILAENDHFQKPEDEENHEMFVYMNMADLQDNRKPEGYNRKGKFRLIFPTDRMEFYVRSFTAKPPDLQSVAERIGEMLSAAGIKYTMEQNQDCLD